VKAIVTGGEGGIGRAIRARLGLEGYEVESLDLVHGFDVSDPAAWEEIEAVDLACLNAGVATGEGQIRKLTDEQYRRALGVNVDGVVIGVRRLARAMDGGAIVVTASLAGLTPMAIDPIYTLTKHPLIGFVRSADPDQRRLSWAHRHVDAGRPAGGVRGGVVPASLPAGSGRRRVGRREERGVR
jgi:NAD(P)-dependent dehydrogenase (short-subunit alcohol dehydrogenase family)